VSWLQWVFSGVGVLGLSGLGRLAAHLWDRRRRKKTDHLSDEGGLSPTTEPVQPLETVNESTQLLNPLPSVPLLQFFGPSPAGDVDLGIRVAVQLPGSGELGFGTEPASRLQLEERERRLTRVLGVSLPGAWPVNGWRLVDHGCWVHAGLQRSRRYELHQGASAAGTQAAPTARCFRLHGRHRLGSRQVASARPAGDSRPASTDSGTEPFPTQASGCSGTCCRDGQWV